MKDTAQETARRVALLSRCPAFAAVPGEALRILAEMMRIERYQEGEFLFEEGDVADRIFVVSEGELEVLAGPERSGRRCIGPAELFGEYGFFLDRTRSASVRARRPSTLLTLGYERFEAHLTAFPESALALLRLAVRRLHALESGSTPDGTATQAEVTI